MDVVGSRHASGPTCGEITLQAPVLAGLLEDAEIFDEIEGVLAV